MPLATSSQILKIDNHEIAVTLNKFYYKKNVLKLCDGTFEPPRRYKLSQASRLYNEICYGD